MNRDHRGSGQSAGAWSMRDLLILALLSLFAVQCVRSNFFNNESSGIDWARYAAGTERMPYQGRVGMVPELRWAEGNPWMVRAAQKYQSMMVAGARYKEPVTVEKFASLVIGLISMLVLLGFTVWYGRRRHGGLWWLPAVLMMEILTVTLVVRSEHTAWTPYDLPHTALFGMAVMCAFEGWWVAMLALFALDVPVRETSIFLLVVAIPFAYLNWRETPRGLLKVAAMAAAMVAYWEAWHVAIARRFAQNPNDTGPRFMENLHEVLFPHHWPQMLCVGGYLILFIWLERRVLERGEKLLLYCTLACVPVTLYFGVWGETRIWLEWTLPWAVLGAAEVRHYWRRRQASGQLKETTVG